MTTTYDVRFWKTETYRGKRAVAYKVRWTVSGRPWKASFHTAAQADSFRSELLAAARRGEAFDTETGRPVTSGRTRPTMAWYELAVAFVDMKWPRVAATTRRTHAEALTAVTVTLLTTDRGRPDGPLLRHALCRWAFNTARRDDSACPDDVRAALAWVRGHTRLVTELATPDVLRRVLDGLTVRLDGKPAAVSVVSRRRKILSTALEYAVELGLLDVNPIPALKWSAPAKSTAVVDRRRVANPVQVRTLLATVRELRPSGPRLVAFFGCLYFAALRPEEAAGLAKHNLSLPAVGWGVLYVERAEPHAGRDWTNSGANRDLRGLKQRPRGEVRPVPSPPELTALLHEHVGRFGTGPDGRLFVGERNAGELPTLTTQRVWQRARRAAFTPEVAATPLAKTPYDLRHAAVSTWLNAGIPAPQVAEWAGHSVDVLLKIYAKCLDSGDALLHQRVQAALGHRQGS